MKFRLIYGSTLSAIFITFAIVAMSGGFRGVPNWVAERPFVTIFLYVFTAAMCASLVDDGPNSQG